MMKREQQEFTDRLEVWLAKVGEALANNDAVLDEIAQSGPLSDAARKALERVSQKLSLLRSGLCEVRAKLESVSSSCADLPAQIQDSSAD